MMRRTRLLILALVLVLALLLAACDSEDDDGEPESAPAATPTVETDAGEGEAGESEASEDEGAGGFSPGGAAISLGGNMDPVNDSGLPGCSDPDDEACPAALQMTLDGTASADGVTVQYPARYFNALTGNDVPDGVADDVLIHIEPSENNRYAEEAVFDIYPVESVEAALEPLADPEIVDWSTDTLTGQIGVSKDTDQDPPVNTTIGAFEAEGGRAVAVKLTTTGKYGWDLWLLVYRDVVASMTIEPAE